MGISSASAAILGSRCGIRVNGASAPLSGFYSSFWKLADTSDALGSLTLTNNNGATFAAGKIGDAATLVRASTQFFSTAFTFTGPACTASAWFKTTLVGGNAGIFQFTAPDTTQFYVRLNTTGNIVLGTNAGGTSLLTSSGTYNDGNWHLVIASHASDGTNSLIIDNGTPQTLGGNSNPGAGAATITIGSTVAGAQAWNGQIDAVGFSDNQVMSTAQTTATWNGGVGVEPPF